VSGHAYAIGISDSNANSFIDSSLCIGDELVLIGIVGFLRITDDGERSVVDNRIAGKKQNFVGHKFWARGYYVGADEKVIRAYIRNQESEDKRLDELSLFDRSK